MPASRVLPGFPASSGMFTSFFLEGTSPIIVSPKIDPNINPKCNGSFAQFKPLNCYLGIEFGTCWVEEFPLHPLVVCRSVERDFIESCHNIGTLLTNKRCAYVFVFLFLSFFMVFCCSFISHM